MKSSFSIFGSILLACLLLSACSLFNDPNKGPFAGHIAGQTINLATQRPEPGVLVHLQLRDHCLDNNDPECWSVIASTTSDDEGYFSLDYSTPSRDVTEARMALKGYKDGFFVLYDPGSYITLARDSAPVGMYPHTYLRVSIKDEEPYESGYAGMELTHTVYQPNDNVYQFPLDTTVIITGNPMEKNYGFNNLRYALVYNRPNTVGSLNFIHDVGCPPHDTCDLFIRF